MSAYRYEQERVVVAVKRTPDEAEMIKMTLAAHGYESSVSASGDEGMRVQVMASDEAAVREILAKLGLGAT